MAGNNGDIGLYFSHYLKTTFKLDIFHPFYCYGKICYLPAYKNMLDGGDVRSYRDSREYTKLSVYGSLCASDAFLTSESGMWNPEWAKNQDPDPG